MSKQYLIIGAGHFGSSVAATLYELGHDVTVVDIDAALVQQLGKSVSRAIQADATSDAALNSLGIKDFDVVVVGIGREIQSSIMVCILLIEMGARYIVAKAQSELHGRVLSKIGVNRVVFPERDMGQKLAHSLSAFNIVDLIELSSNSSVVEVAAPAEMVGRSLQELNLRARYGINVIALRDKEGKTNISPGAEDKINEQDMIVAVGDIKALKKMGWI